MLCTLFHHMLLLYPVLKHLKFNVKHCEIHMDDFPLLIVHRAQIQS